METFHIRDIKRRKCEFLTRQLEAVATFTLSSGAVAKDGLKAYHAARRVLSAMRRVDLFDQLAATRVALHGIDGAYASVISVRNRQHVRLYIPHSKVEIFL